MNAKVYYHIEADQLVIVWPMFRLEFRRSGMIAYKSVQSFRFAMEGLHATLLVSGDEIKKQCVKIGDFDEDQP